MAIKRVSVRVRDFGVTEYASIADMDVEVGNSLYFFGTTNRDVVVSDLDGHVWGINIEELVKAVVEG